MLVENGTSVNGMEQDSDYIDTVQVKRKYGKPKTIYSESTTQTVGNSEHVTFADTLDILIDSVHENHDLNIST